MLYSPARLQGIFFKWHLDRWVFSHLLMNNLAFAETLECLWDPRRVVAAMLLFALAHGLGRGMVFAKDSFLKAILTAPNLYLQLAQVNRAIMERSLPMGKAEPCCSSTSVLVHHLLSCSRTFGHQGIPLAGS